MKSESEKRRHVRANLHWTVYLFRDGSTHPSKSETRNLSSGGFYCDFDDSRDDLLEVGESLRCRIILPGSDTNSVAASLFLDCRVTVIRVEPVSLTRAYGIACAIQDYSIVHLDRMRPADTMARTHTSS